MCGVPFLICPNLSGGYLDYLLRARRRTSPALGKEVNAVAKNTGKGHRTGAVKGRSEFKHGTTWFKRDASTGRILNGSPKQHKGVRNEK